MLMVLISTNIFSQEENIFIFSKAEERAFVYPDNSYISSRDSVIKSLIINFEGIAFIYNNLNDMKGVRYSKVTSGSETMGSNTYTVLYYKIIQFDKINISEVKIYILGNKSGFFVITLNDGVEIIQKFYKIKFPSKD